MVREVYEHIYETVDVAASEEVCFAGLILMFYSNR